MNHFFTFVTTITFLFGTQISWGQPSYLNPDRCSPAFIKHAEKEITRLRRVAPAVWVDAVYTSFTKYGICDQGNVSDNYDKSVSHLLIKNWKQLPKLSGYLNKYPLFAEFFFFHALSPNNKKDINTIVLLARTECPLNYSSLCVKLVSLAPQNQ